MELLAKSREELFELTRKLNLKVAKNISDDNLRDAIETGYIRKTVEMEETVRLKLQEESRMRQDIATIEAEAESRGITIKIPADPTLANIATLKKKLDIIIKTPKPSPETLAIENSKKVYAQFHNREQEDMDIPSFTVGGKYWFRLFPEKIHVLPLWLINHWRKTAVAPVYDKKMVPNPEAVAMDGMVEQSVKVGVKQRWLFEIRGDAPDNASFGVVLDKKILDKLELKEPAFV